MNGTQSLAASIGFQEVHTAKQQTQALKIGGRKLGT